MAYEPYIALAERLNALAPFPGPGQDDVPHHRRRGGGERGQDRARRDRALGGHRLFRRAFTAARMLTMALTGKVVPYKKGFGPMPGDVFHVPFPIAHYGVDGGGFAEGAEASCSRPTSTRRAWPPSSSSRCRAKAASTSRRPSCCAGCASSATSMASSDRRRGADRLRAHRQDVRHRAFRRRARPRDHRQVAGRRLSAVRRDRARQGHGCGRIPAAWAAPMPVRRSRVRRRWPCSTSSRKKSCVQRAADHRRAR